MGEAKAVAVPEAAPYEDAYAQRAGARRSEPEALRALRAAAMDRFRADGFPSARLEAWKKTSLARLATLRPRLPAPPGEAALERAQVVVDAVRQANESARFVLVDGVFAPSLSTTDPVLGLEAVPIVDAARRGDAVGDLVPPPAPEWALSDLNTALFAGGLHLRVGKGAEVDGLLHIVHVTTGAEEPLFVAPRHRFQLEAGARATIVETYAGLGDGPAFTDAVTEAAVGEGARLRRVKVQREPLVSSHVALFAARVGRDAVLEDVSFSLGARLARHDVHATLAGTGAHATLNGVFLGRLEQHVDHRTTIDHALPQGTSRQVYKGIVDDAAHGVFTGRIIVRPGAQQTDADQQNKNLVLSRKALVDTTPQLEIHADDVKCAHGSAIGRLDEAQLFYLRTRGIPDADARLLLTEAFSREPLTVIGEEELRGHLEGLVTDWFIAGHPESDPADPGHPRAGSDPLKTPLSALPREGTRKTV